MYNKTIILCLFSIICENKTLNIKNVKIHELQRQVAKEGTLGKRRDYREKGGIEKEGCIGERVGTRLTTSAIDSEVRREQCPVYG